MAAPYVISGIIRNMNNTAVVENATVIVRNVTKNELQTQLTNNLGEFLIDLANALTDYSNGDRVQITAWVNNGSDRIVLDRRHTVDTVVGSHDTGQLILHPLGDHMFSSAGARYQLLSFSASNRAASVSEVHLFDRKNDRLVHHITIPAQNTINQNFGLFGKEFEGGICVIYSAEGTTAITYVGDSAATNIPTVTVALSFK